MPNNFKFTRLQKQALTRLKERDATSSRKGLTAILDKKLNVMALGRLRRLGLVDSTTISRTENFGQHTVYWLTEDGAREAKALTDKERTK